MIGLGLKAHRIILVHTIALGQTASLAITPNNSTLHGTTIAIDPSWPYGTFTHPFVLQMKWTLLPKINCSFVLAKKPLLLLDCAFGFFKFCLSRHSGKRQNAGNSARRRISGLTAEMWSFTSLIWIRNNRKDWHQCKKKWPETFELKMTAAV